MATIPFVYDDGGRGAAGYTGKAGDCCARAFAIATGLPYKVIYDRINELAERERRGKKKRGISSARTGVYKSTAHRLAYDLCQEHDLWACGSITWVPTMFVGQGCKVHLRADELPQGRLILALSKHYAAVIDGVLHDTFQDDRNGTRCVYGYWIVRHPALSHFK